MARYQAVNLDRGTGRAQIEDRLKGEIVGVIFDNLHLARRIARMLNLLDLPAALGRWGRRLLPSGGWLPMPGSAQERHDRNAAEVVSKVWRRG